MSDGIPKTKEQPDHSKAATTDHHDHRDRDDPFILLGAGRGRWKWCTCCLGHGLIAGIADEWNTEADSQEWQDNCQADAADAEG